ncbi:MAG: S-methyl-5'-thioinosine phosphorylase [Candidatus Thiodiazotropha sp.]|nr:S-methyl-5'-thioinosine phosphorylase [Candidatus Thiodiazotropha taylori]MBT3062204.1 S-methyl-5'-thioinosine phosphorylase [Candidatus Thiodiazotropha sp. (ex Lucina pensylvanica)]MBV2096410.1 S-methyl-5'-thioinosine phosphorylase [Candidatus Thiodiazotropha sp. (ex Codakia orbicularis)]
MTKLAIIGGTGLDEIPDLEITHREVCHTPFGEPSAALTHGTISGHQVVFLPRHGASHMIPPHLVNYRANLWSLRHVGIQTILGVAAVGGISAAMAPGRIVIPDQIIDYTFGRDHTIFDSDLSHVTHIDFTKPYCEGLRQALLEAGRLSSVNPVAGGTYGATQGPRLETAAEILRMERDGCDIVGMTGMPEAALAREFNLCYASCAVISNWAAGKMDSTIDMSEIEKNLVKGMEQVKSLFVELLRLDAW